MREEELNKLFFSKEGTQMAHEKMLNVTNHQGNANQSHDEMSPHTCGVAIIKKTRDD